jgi:hypothetical protein
MLESSELALDGSAATAQQESPATAPFAEFRGTLLGLAVDVVDPVDLLGIGLDGG